MRSAVLVLGVIVVFVAVGYAQPPRDAQGKFAGKNPARHSNSFISAEALRLLIKNARDQKTEGGPRPAATATTPTAAAADHTTPTAAVGTPTAAATDGAADGTTPTAAAELSEEQIEEINALELATCEGGLVGAFIEAFQQDPTVWRSTLRLDCPAFDDFTWTLVAEDPFTLCVMAPARLRTLAECARRYMETSPVPALYHMLENATFTVTSASDNAAFNAEQEQALCGEDGLDGAFAAAFNSEVNAYIWSMPEEPDCPAYDAYIWSFLEEVPLAMCLLDPVHLRVGVECVKHYMWDTPMPLLYILISEIHSQYVENSLTGTPSKQYVSFEKVAQRLQQTTMAQDMPAKATKFGCWF